MIRTRRYSLELFLWERNTHPEVRVRKATVQLYAFRDLESIYFTFLRFITKSESLVCALMFNYRASLLTALHRTFIIKLHLAVVSCFTALLISYLSLLGEW